MITVLYFLLASVFVCPSRAVTLSVPNKISSGTSVQVKWTRDGSDPVAFDLSQYQVEGLRPSILSITQVNNSASEKSGTVSVLFSTPGQVLFQAFAQHLVTFAPMVELPDPLSHPPNQINIGPGASEKATPAPPGPANPPPTSPTTSTTSTAGAFTTDTPAVPVPIETSSTIITTNGETSSASLAGDTTTSALLGGTTSTRSSDVSGFESSPSTTKLTVSSTLTYLYPHISASPNSTNTSTNPTAGGPPNGAVSAPHRGMSRAAMIALAVLLPLLILVLGIMVYCYCMRRSKRQRIALFTNNWLRVRRRASPSSDDYGPGQRGPGDPEEAARSGVDEKYGSAHPPRPTMRFQEMVTYLAEKNAARYKAAT